MKLLDRAADFCVSSLGQIGKSVGLHSCMSRGCSLATSYQSPLQQRIVWPSEDFTLSLRSLGKRMGTQKRKPMTLLGPAQGKTLVLNLCMGMVVNRCFTADLELSAFICGENSDILVIVAMGNRYTIA